MCNHRLYCPRWVVSSHAELSNTLFLLQSQSQSTIVIGKGCALQTFWRRASSDDLLYMFLTIINAYFAEIPMLQSMRAQVSPLFPWCMHTHSQEPCRLSCSEFRLHVNSGAFPRNTLRCHKGCYPLLGTSVPRHHQLLAGKIFQFPESI